MACTYWIKLCFKSLSVQVGCFFVVVVGLVPLNILDLANTLVIFQPIGFQRLLYKAHC